MAMQKPSVGRIVHYVAYGTPGGEFPAGVCRAAIITELNPAGEMVLKSGSIKLAIVNPTGLFFSDWLTYSDQNKPGTWHWPEQVN